MKINPNKGKALSFTRARVKGTAKLFPWGPNDS